MQIQTFLRITSATTIVIGLSFLLVPIWLVNFFLTAPLTEGSIFVRFLGSSIIGYSFLNLYASMYNRLELVKANLVGNFVTLFIAFVLSIVGLAAGSLNKYGMLIMLLHAVFGAGFGYYLYKLNK